MMNGAKIMPSKALVLAFVAMVVVTLPMFALPVYGSQSAQTTAQASQSPAVGVTASAMATQPAIAAGQATAMATLGATEMVGTLSATEQASMQAAAAKCSDKPFTSGMATDLKAATSIVQAFNASNLTQALQSLTQISTLSQKYEDMLTVPAGCQAAQFALIAALASYSNAVALAFAAKAEPNDSNAAVYTQQIPIQIARANQFLAIVSKGMPV